MSRAEVLVVDAVVIGGGLAGLYGVLHMPPGWDVAVVDKGAAHATGSSPLAQGGMAVAVGRDDSPGLHAQDTLRAGAGAGVRAAVEVLTEQAVADLEHLVRLGCAFDRTPSGELDLNLEGGQSVPRSVHWQDATGREIMRVVLDRAREHARRLEGAAVALVVRGGRCVGALVVSADGSSTTVLGRAVLLASGGSGALYQTTTNVAWSTGDAVAMAFAAGAAVSDMEFVQFHPTVLAAGGLQRVLLTEALRGDGAIVVDARGNRFLFEHDPRGELAPRDVVARAIAGRGGALLDARPVGAQRLRERFPNVLAAARDAGYDLTAAPAPVAPAAHYALGGVATDLEGRTSLPGLYAAGECAASGVHGANRMAGNSLAETVVFGRLSALALVREAGTRPAPDAERPMAAGSDDAAGWARLRTAMSSGAGLVRTAASLASARAVAEELASEAPGQALRLAAGAAALICRSAAARDESRGVHFRADEPRRKAEWDGVHVTMLASQPDAGRAAR